MQFDHIPDIHAAWPIGRVSRCIWADPACIRENAYPHDAAHIRVSPDNGRAFGFHLTSSAGAQAILRDGPRMSNCKVGFDARQMPPGFYVSSIPLLADGHEQWMPHLDAVEKVYLGVEFTWTGKQVVEEPTWACLQMCLQPEHIITITALAPEDLVEFRSREAINALADGFEVGPPEPYHFMPYRRAILLKAMSIDCEENSEEAA